MTQVQDPALWDQFIATLPQTHLLQSWEWGEVKSAYGWKPQMLLWKDDSDHGGMLQAAALVLIRSISLGKFTASLRVMYIPKGPLLDWDNPALRRQVMDDLKNLGRGQGVIFIKIDPNVILGRGYPGQPGCSENRFGQTVVQDLRESGWNPSRDQIQFRNTVWLDLSPSQDEILARMKQKTRYNIRLAERKGVQVRLGTRQDYDLLYRMYAETSVRDGFVIRDEAYYRKVWDTFLKNAKAQPDACLPTLDLLIAEVEGEATAGLVLFRFAGTAWYLYGMSRDLHREKMPNYLLQWKAICRAKEMGCQTYDLWGAPDEFSEADPLWGVYRFKEGLGGQSIRTIGAWDLPIQPLTYRLYTQTLPRLLNVLRRQGKDRTRRMVEG
jgi:lipid II:glycine glycyltransferase (peptidoglycan interpeptide bridge formation enzyme)